MNAIRSIFCWKSTIKGLVVLNLIGGTCRVFVGLSLDYASDYLYVKTQELTEGELSLYLDSMCF